MLLVITKKTIQGIQKIWKYIHLWPPILWIDPSPKYHNALVLYPTMHHFITEMYTCVHISLTKWCIAEYVWCIVGYVRWVFWRFLCHSFIYKQFPSILVLIIDSKSISTKIYFDVFLANLLMTSVKWFRRLGFTRQQAFAQTNVDKIHWLYQWGVMS